MGADYISVCPSCHSEEYEWDETFVKYRCKECKAMFDTPITEDVAYDNE